MAVAMPETSLGQTAPGAPQFASLYVGDLDKTVTEAMLYDIFNSVGPVASIRVCRDNITRQSLGYAYVNFHSVADAERALDTLNYSAIKDRSCRIMWSHRDPNLRKSGSGNIFVKNLDKSVDNKALYDTFSLFGNILSCKVTTDAGGKSQGYGFVHFESSDAATQAIERINGKQIGDRNVWVGNFVKRHEREKPEVTNFTNLYLKNFPDSWTEEDVRKAIAPFGLITSLAMKKDKKGRKFAFVNVATPEEAKKTIDGLHCSADYRTPDEIARTKDLPSVPDEFFKLYCQRAQLKSERSRDLTDRFHGGKTENKEAALGFPSGVNLYVKNLSESMNDKGLQELFGTFGTITSAKVMCDDRARGKGFGFVCFKSPDEATKAVSEMHLKVIGGKPLYVGLAEKKDERGARLAARYKNPNSMGNPNNPMMGNPMMNSGPPMHPGANMMMKGNMKGMPQFPPNSMMGMPNQMHMQKGMPQGMYGPMGGAPQMFPPAMGGMMHAMGGMPGMVPPGGKPMGVPMKGGHMGKGGPGMMGAQRPPMNMAPGGKGAPARPMSSQPRSDEPLTASSLAAAPPGMQKQMLGERLFPRISRFQPELAGKITGMMLEMDNSELLMLLDSEPQLKSKVEEAIKVLESMGGKK